MAESDQVVRRRRPPISCTLCRRRKLRCDRERPCGNCAKSKTGNCIYVDLGSRSPQTQPQPELAVPGPRSTCSSTTPSTARSSCGVSSVSGPAHTPASSSNQAPTPAPTSRPPSDDAAVTTASQLNTGDRLFFRPHYEENSAVSRCVYVKTRCYGQSHWLNVLSMETYMFRDLIALEPSLRDRSSKVFVLMDRCKALSKTIKSHRIPAWPTLPTRDLPDKATADALVDCYLRTTETVYRVLHIPTFKRDYDSLWTEALSSPAAPDVPEFLVMLKLVLAIGATTFDANFSMRASAIRWVHEGLCYLSAPNLKQRLSIQTMQLHILLIIAREAVHVGSRDIWVYVGDLIRRAMQMGLHQDPKPRQPQFGPGGAASAHEIRRRLWNTILELSVQSSLAAGSPPLIHLHEFSTTPPRNFDDDQLVVAQTSGPETTTPKPEDEITQSSIARALRQSFNARLAVVGFLNGVGPRGSYEEALRLDAELRASYKLVRNILNGRGPPLAPFALRMVDLIMHSYLTSLHIPYLGHGVQNTPAAQAFSRMVVGETAYKIWRLVYRPVRTTRETTSLPLDNRDQQTGDTQIPFRAEGDHPDGIFDTDDDFARFTLCGNGFNRLAARQAAVLISIELRSLIQESYSLSGVMLAGDGTQSRERVVPRPDFLNATLNSADWSLGCVRSGDTNVKYYVHMCVVAAQTEALINGMGPEDTNRMIYVAALNAIEKAASVLEAMAGAAASSSETDAGSLSHAQPDITPAGALEGWDFVTADGFAAPPISYGEFMNWVFDWQTAPAYPQDHVGQPHS